MSGGSLSYQSSKTITGAESALSSKDFIYVKNIDGDDVKISLDNGSNYLVRLSEDESFASELDASVATVIISTDGTSTIEYLSGT